MPRQRFIISTMHAPSASSDDSHEATTLEFNFQRMMPWDFITGHRSASLLASISASSESHSRKASQKASPASKVQMIVSTLKGLPQQFMAQQVEILLFKLLGSIPAQHPTKFCALQAIAGRIYEFHSRVNGFFARECPECRRSVFLVPKYCQ